ncbi:pyridoxal phosphate-dependent aminotransferase [Paracrocinitomix mangrovi]|uniref:pyridoxal phosphate-dependent aminotransferase n=1 Tax=Paracrocinitomix mangrovi TaxID=2862509 RepID=UPI001C8EAEA3|nr:pyridoxal phosphate-dependent aminotransferase [Paracrocinitomix mangrovi]UKN02837.1 pyridoxal phosphate-dependent aminotransferase [Paracrocinitomix mangrovi]
MSRLSERVNNLAESATIAMAAKSRELIAQGKDIISLSLGEPDFNVPDFVKVAAKEAVDQNFSKYMPVPGYKDLQEAIAGKFLRDNGLKYDADQIVVSTGAKQSIVNVVMAMVNEGDEVIVPVPYWVTYAEQVALFGGEPVFVKAGIESDFKITADQLEAAITPKTKLMIFSNPCNPTGSAYSREELASLAAVIKKYPNLVVIADEIYEHINFVGKNVSLAAFDDIYEQVVTVNGVSKAFAMTGYRIGYIGAPKDIAKACAKLQGQFTSGASSIAQRATKAAVEADPSEIKFMVDAFHKRRDLVLQKMGEIDGVKLNVPEGAFYVFPDITNFFGKSYGNHTIQSATDLSMYLLDEALVAVVTGEAFGDPNCIRLSYAAAEETLIAAIDRIKLALDKLS